MELDEILTHYDLGPVTGTKPLGGTAGATLRIETADDAFVLRRRGLRTSGVARVAYDGRLRGALRAAGLPLVAPVPTKRGDDGVPTDEGFWELTPYVAGREHRYGDRDELASVARTLSAFHRAGARIRAKASPPPHQQFTLAVPGTPESTRIDDPAVMCAALQTMLPGLEESSRAVARRMLELLERIASHFDGQLYSGIDTYVAHGDLHPANILFSDSGEVAGLFDLDWAAPAPRVRDLADMVWFFAGAPLTDGQDIWALTAAREVDRELARLLLREYNALLPLAPAEMAVLPWAWLSRWIAMHIEGMYKVPPDLRGRFLARDMGEPVDRMLSTGFAGLI